MGRIIRMVPWGVDIYEEVFRWTGLVGLGLFPRRLCYAQPTWAYTYSNSFLLSPFPKKGKILSFFIGLHTYYWTCIIIICSVCALSVWVGLRIGWKLGWNWNKKITTRISKEREDHIHICYWQCFWYLLPLFFSSFCLCMNTYLSGRRCQAKAYNHPKSEVHLCIPHLWSNQADLKL